MEDFRMTTWQIWAIVGAASFLAVVGIAFLWARMTVFRWYCRRCKKIVSSGRFHPGKCACGTHSLVAYFCSVCTSWNTTPASNWHCSDCSSQKVVLGVEYQFFTRLWKWRNQRA
jgi:hypothetical protein